MKLQSIDLNTLKGIRRDLVAKKFTVMSIASECNMYEDQSTCEYAQSIYARLADCTNRKQMNAVLDSVEGV